MGVWRIYIIPNMTSSQKSHRLGYGNSILRGWLTILTSASTTCINGPHPLAAPKKLNFEWLSSNLILGYIRITAEWILSNVTKTKRYGKSLWRFPEHRFTSVRNENHQSCPVPCMRRPSLRTRWNEPYFYAYRIGINSHCVTFTPAISLKETICHVRRSKDCCSASTSRHQSPGLIALMCRGRSIYRFHIVLFGVES